MAQGVAIVFSGQVERIFQMGERPFQLLYFRWLR